MHVDIDNEEGKVTRVSFHTALFCSICYVWFGMRSPHTPWANQIYTTCAANNSLDAVEPGVGVASGNLLDDASACANSIVGHNRNHHQNAVRITKFPDITLRAMGESQVNNAAPIMFFKVDVNVGSYRYPVPCSHGVAWSRGAWRKFTESPVARPPSTHVIFNPSRQSLLTWKKNEAHRYSIQKFADGFYVEALSVTVTLSSTSTREP